MYIKVYWRLEHGEFKSLEQSSHIENVLGYRTKARQTMDKTDLHLLHQMQKYGRGQSSWMVRKVLGAKKMLHIFHNEAAWNESMIRQACKQILGSFFEGRMDKSYLF